MKDGRLEFAMAGGGIGSFIGPVHRMAAGLDASATLAAGCFSRDANTGIYLEIIRSNINP